MRSLANPLLRLDYLAEGGPRLLRLIPAGLGENLLAETPDLGWPTPFGRFRLLGGHRLWFAPEDPPRTSSPDDGGGLEITPLGAGLVRLQAPAEAASGLAKCLELRLHPHEPRLRLRHILTNHAALPVELAPWAITMLRTGGTAILPLASPDPQAASRLPDRLLALWPYARWDDPRLRLFGDRLEVDTAEGGANFKIGAFCHAGWCAYRWQGWTLVKRFTAQPEQPHPDRGCNAEVFVHPRFVELETLGPLARLAPGEAVEHVEEWEVREAGE